MRHSVDRYVERLLRGRRPKSFAPSQDDVAIARTAIELLAARADAAEPRADFVADLRLQLAAVQQEHQDQQYLQNTDDVESRPVNALRRRRILQATALTATGAGAGVAAAQLFADQNTANPSQTTSSAAQLQIIPTHGSWQTVAATTDLAEGAVLSFDLGTVTGFLQRASGQVRAISGICTHQGCRLQLTPPRNLLACPCHGATFSLAGESVTHPQSVQALRPLPRLDVREADGQIQIFAPSV